MKNSFAVVVSAIAALAAGAEAEAAYMMSIASNGSSSAVVLPGDSVLLQVELSSDGGDVHNSAIFRMIFSAPGLKFLGYEWASPYLNGTLDDDSKPLANMLPLLLDDGTLSGVGYPNGVVDIEFSNVLPVGPNFGSSVLVTLELEVPDNYSGDEVIQISLAPDQIAIFGNEIETHTDQGFTLFIPAPSAWVMVCGAGMVGMRRGRRTV